MITHEFKADPFGRDACDSKEDDADEGRVSHCGRLRSEHVDAEHGLRIQLVAALRERDDFKALNERSLERLHEAHEALAAARRAAEDADKVIQRYAADAGTAIRDLAAARRECDATRKVLRTATVRIGILLDRMRGCNEQVRQGRRDKDGHDLSLFEGEAWIKEQEAALAAPAAGEEGKR